MKNRKKSTASYFLALKTREIHRKPPIFSLSINKWLLSHLCDFCFRRNDLSVLAHVPAIQHQLTDAGLRLEHWQHEKHFVFLGYLIDIRILRLDVCTVNG